MIAFTGHSGMHTAQSMHSSGSITSMFGPSLEAIDGAHVDAVGVFALDAAFRDDVGHRAILELEAHPGEPRKSKLYGFRPAG